LTSRYYNGSLDEYNVWKTDIPISKLYPQLYEVGQTPFIANFAAWNTAGTAPHTTYLYDTSTNLAGVETFAWNFGDGNTSTSQNVYYTWNATGEYNVTHTVSNGISSSTSFMNVTVGTPTPAVVTPVASFYGSPTTGNVPLSVSFTDVSSNTPTSWFWEFGDGTNSTLQNPSHAYTRSGFKNVALTATNSAGSNITVRLKFVRVS
jgi:PKD repeat protein